MRYLNFFKIAILSTTLFTSSVPLFAVGGEEENTASTSAPAKLSDRDQLGLDYANFRIAVQQWDGEEAERNAVNADILVIGLEVMEKRDNAILRLLGTRQNNLLARAITSLEPDYVKLLLSMIPHKDHDTGLYEMIFDSLSVICGRAQYGITPSDELDPALRVLIAMKEIEFSFNHGLEIPGYKPNQIMYEHYITNHRHSAYLFLLGLFRDNHFENDWVQKSDLLDTKRGSHLYSAYEHLANHGLAHLIRIRDEARELLSTYAKTAGYTSLDTLEERSQDKRRRKSQLRQLNKAAALLTAQ